MHKYLFACLLALAPAFAANSPIVVSAAEAALEKHVMAISEELRCLVCQNQTIADSHADLAIDLRNQVREKLVLGISDRDVIDFMVQRYGDFVLYRPPFKATTWLLWLGPLLLLAGGLGLLAANLCRRQAAEVPAAPAELAHAAALLRNTTENEETK